MANKGNTRHIQGLAAPWFFSINRKEQTYVLKPNAGRHTLQRSLPLGLAMKRLALASTANDAKKILKNGNVRVNGNVIKELRYPIGLSDTLEIEGAGKSYTITINEQGKSVIDEVSKKGESQPYKVVGKYKTKKGVVMVRLHDGRITKAENSAKVNDSVLVDANGAIKKVLPLKEGAECFVIDGVHVGKTGKIKSISKGSMNVTASAVITTKSGEFETIIKNIMIVS